MLQEEESMAKTNTCYCSHSGTSQQTVDKKQGEKRGSDNSVQLEKSKSPVTRETHGKY
jgi:hypothetical protein